MRNTYHNIFLLFHLLLLNCISLGSFNEEFELVVSDSKIGDSFASNLSNIDSYTTHLCNLPTETILAICNYAFTEMRNLQKIKLKYLSEIASSMMNFRCTIKPVILYLTNKINVKVTIQQKLLQCYGRHYPVRTSWLEDDAFDSLEVCGGWDEDSGTSKSHLFILKRKFKKTKDLYIPVAMIRNFIITKLPTIQVNRKNLHTELISIENIARNEEIDEIEEIYLRYRNKASKLEEYDPVCNLKTSMKILLCEKLMAFSSLEHYWVLNKDAFNDHSSQCRPNPLYLRKHQSNELKNTNTIVQMMYPCYGRQTYMKNAGPWYLSTGPSDNSVLMFTPLIYYPKINDALYTIGDLFENIKLENLENIN